MRPDYRSVALFVFVRSVALVSTVALFVIVVLWPGGPGYAAYGPCNKDCKNVNVTGYADADGVTLTCYRYQNEATSCWICGSGSPGGGYCQAGDPTLKCTQKPKTVQYKKNRWGVQLCDPKQKNAYVVAAIATGFADEPGTYTETLYLCDVPSK